MATQLLPADELGNKIRYPHQSILNDFAGSYKHPLCVHIKYIRKCHMTEKHGFDIRATSHRTGE